jgi:hypothetical protein
MTLNETIAYWIYFVLAVGFILWLVYLAVDWRDINPRRPRAKPGEPEREIRSKTQRESPIE